MEAVTDVGGPGKRPGLTVALDGLWFTGWPGQVTGPAGPHAAGKPASHPAI
jgi:hypothetical protein